VNTAGPELIVEAGEKQRGRFAGYPGHAQDHPRKNSLAGGWNYNGCNRLPLTGAQCQSPLPQERGHLTKKLLGVPRDNRDQHDTESDRPGKSGKATHRDDDESPGEYTYDNGGNSVEQVRRVADQKCEVLVFELRQIDSGEEAHWKTDGGGKSNDLNATQNGIPHAAAEFARW